MTWERVLVWALLAIILVAIALVVLYRLIFGRRLHMTGGRSRQPRLGVVDAFDLDRQRQLVLIRRDNVEHLLMIGGPNDIVIESAFVRAQPTLAAPVSRDKDIGLPPAPAAPIPPLPSLPELADVSDLRPALIASPPDPPRGAEQGRGPAGFDLGGPVVPTDLGPLADIPAPGPLAQGTPPAPAEAEQAAPSASPPAATEPAPAAPTPSRLFPTRSAATTPPRPAAGAFPPRTPLSSLRPITPARTGSLLQSRPTPLAPLQRGTSAASLKRDPSVPPAPSPEAGAQDTQAGGDAKAGDDAPSAPATAPAAVPVAAGAGALVTTESNAPPSAPITLESIESLEEEMAKLLGRAATTDRT